MHAVQAPARISSLEAADERFQVRGTLAIVALLRKMIEHRGFVTVHAGPDFFVTALLAVDEDDGTLVFDYGVDAALTDRLLRAPRLTVVTQLDHVRVQFVLERAQRIDYEGSPAFRAPLPPFLTRLQRREYYRLRIPRGRPLMCEVPIQDARAPDGTRRVAMQVHDISAGGLMLYEGPDDFAPETGTELRGCAIDLPDLGHISLDLRIVHVQDGGGRGPHGARLGCCFLGISPATVNLIQRYINRVEREQRALV